MLHCYLNQEDLVEEGKEEENKEKPSNMFVLLITVKNRFVLIIQLLLHLSLKDLYYACLRR